MTLTMRSKSGRYGLALLSGSGLFFAMPAICLAADPPPADVKTITEAENVPRAAERAPQDTQPLPPKEIVESGEAADARSPRMRDRRLGILPGRILSPRATNAPLQRITGYRGSPTDPFIPANPDGAYLGVELKAEFPEAAIVSRVLPGSAAEAAGLREGDRIWGLDDQRVESANELIFRLGQIAPGDAVQVHFDRAHSVPVTLGQRAQPASARPTVQETQDP